MARTGRAFPSRQFPGVGAAAVASIPPPVLPRQPIEVAGFEREHFHRLRRLVPTRLSYRQPILDAQSPPPEVLPPVVIAVTGGKREHQHRLRRVLPTRLNNPQPAVAAGVPPPTLPRPLIEVAGFEREHFHRFRRLVPTRLSYRQPVLTAPPSTQPPPAVMFSAKGRYPRQRYRKPEGFPSRPSPAAQPPPVVLRTPILVGLKGATLLRRDRRKLRLAIPAILLVVQTFSRLSSPSPRVIALVGDWRRRSRGRTWVFQGATFFIADETTIGGMPRRLTGHSIRLIHATVRRPSQGEGVRLVNPSVRRPPRGPRRIL